MPRETRTISIFLASPADVSAERELVAQTVTEWNQIGGRDRTIYFDLIRWETNVASGFGSDPQQVVQDDIGDHYDALIAIFWTRVGTETPRAQSGSIEEYERALGRYKARESIEIAFFFKDAPVSLKEIDFGQAQAVEELKGRVGAEGALFKEFSDNNALRFELNLLLDKLARKFGAEQSPALILSGSAASLAVAEDHNQSDSGRNEEIGYLDVMESFEKHTEMTNAFLAELTSRFDSMTSENSSITSKIEELGKLGAIQPTEMRPLIAKITNGMDSFSEFLERRGGEYAEHSLGLAEDSRALIDLSRDFTVNEGEISTLEDTIVDLLSSMDENIESIDGVLISTASLQRMTVAFNHARRRLINNLKTYLSDVISARDVVRKALDELRTLRGEFAAGLIA